MDDYSCKIQERTNIFAVARKEKRQQDYIIEVKTKFDFIKSTAVIFLVFVLMLLAIFYCRKYYDNRICTSEECLHSAANLHFSLDLTTHPCDDFYTYVCGRWSQYHPNHGWFSTFSVSSTVKEKFLIAAEAVLTSKETPNEPQAVKKAKQFYNSCTNVTQIDNLGLSVLQKYLQQAGLPLVPSLFSKNRKEAARFKFDWLKADATVKKIFATDVFFGFSVEKVLRVGVPRRRCPLPKYNKELDALLMKFVLSTIIENVTSSKPEGHVLEQAAAVLLTMTSDFDALIKNYTDESLPQEYQFRKSDNYGAIWDNYIQYFLGDVNTTVLVISDFDNEYLQKALGYVLNTSDIYLELYTWWKVVTTMIMSTTSGIADKIAKETALLQEPQVTMSRSLWCARLVNSFMGMAVAYEAINKNFLNVTKPKIEQMIKEVKNAFGQHVSDVTWMQEDDKKASLKKIKEIRTLVGYPAWLLNASSLDNYYKNITLLNDAFLENMLTFSKWYFSKEMEAFNSNDTVVENPTTDLSHVFLDNFAIVPRLVLSFPFYHLGLPILNYGAVGSILGHQIVHEFLELKKDGLWSKSATIALEEKIHCFENNFDNSSGKEVFRENLEVSEGLQQAYGAYQNYLEEHGPDFLLPGFEKFTGGQLFFIVFASIWCQAPGTETKNFLKRGFVASLQNSLEFSEAFSCPVGSRMNPDQRKCRVW